jgi:eukaryotic-like serine/threonine-protein kinase
MALTPAQRETAKKLFDAALDCQTEIRSVFLQNTCQDPHVCDEVERLLAQHAEMGSFLKDVGPASNGSCSSPAEPTFSDGDTLAGRFRIIRFIAHGGMGEVYEAEDLEFCQPVAIKTIRSDLLQTSFLDQFKNEVQLAKQVTHPNVCRIYDLYRHSPLRPNAESDNDTFFVSMELLRGETLAEHLRGRSRLTPEEAFPIIDQIASALEAAHAAGILHRDLKPENIMLVPTGPQGSVRAVVTDFGLALQTKEGHAPTASASPGGTPAYMSPEQLRGDPLTPSSDVYSLGLLMYRIVAGVRAFERGRADAFRRKTLDREASVPSRDRSRSRSRLEHGDSQLSGTRREAAPADRAAGHASVEGRKVIHKDESRQDDFGSCRRAPHFTKRSYF